jgi:hypothetical protein
MSEDESREIDVSKRENLIKIVSNAISQNISYTEEPS